MQANKSVASLVNLLMKEDPNEIREALRLWKSLKAKGITPKDAIKKLCFYSILERGIKQGHQFKKSHTRSAIKKAAKEKKAPKVHKQKSAKEMAGRRKVPIAHVQNSAKKK